MKIMLIILCIFFICSCATQPIKPEVIQNKLGLGMSPADVIATLGIPTEKKSQEGVIVELTYDTYTLGFSNSQLSKAQVLMGSSLSELNLQPIVQIKPEYKADSVVLTKGANLAVSPYQVAAYLQNENLFVKAAEAEVDPNGFTVKTNALCVAISEGYLKGTEAVIKIGYNPDLQLRNEKGIYIFPKSCLSYQKDPALVQQIQMRLAAELEAEAKTDKKDSKSSFNWEAFKEFMKPVPPAQPAKK